MPDIAYQNKDITSKILGEQLKHKSFAAYGLHTPKILQVLPTNLPAVEANELRLDNLFLLEDGSLAMVDYESDYRYEDKVKYLNYLARAIKRYIQEGIFGEEHPIRFRMIVIYTADIEPKQTCRVLDAGCLRLSVEEAFLRNLDPELVERELRDKIEAGEALSEEEQMRFIILPLTHRGKEAKQACIRRCFDLAREMEDEEAQSFLLSGMLVFSDKVIARKDSKRIKEWLMLTKVGQLFEEEKLEYARKAVLQAKKEAKEEADKALLLAKKEAKEEADKALLLAKANAEKEAEEDKKHTVERMIRKGFPNAEILDIIDGISEADVEAIRNEMGRK